jgi:outer membrane protein OmpA-like peptidoglycan-associated protein
VSIRSRLSRFVVALLFVGFISPLPGNMDSAFALPIDRAAEITSISTPNSQTIVITYVPPISADVVTNVFYSTDSGTSYYAPDSDSCTSNPANGPWVGSSDTCTMTVTLQSLKSGGNGIPLLPGVPHSIVLGTFTSSNLPANWLNSPPGNPPTSISNLWMLTGDTSGIGIAPFPVISNIFYGQNQETIYFDNSVNVNKWWGIAISTDSGTTWSTPENPRSKSFSCGRAQYAVSQNFYSCTIYGLTSDSGIQLRYYVNPAGLGSDLQGVPDPNQFEYGAPSETIYFKYSATQNFTVSDNTPNDYYIFDQSNGSITIPNGPVSVIPGEGNLSLGFTSPPITTVGGNGSMRNVYYAYAIKPYVYGQPGISRDDISLWNFNSADLKLIDGESSQYWTISKLADGQPLLNNTSYLIALAYYIPGLSRLISPVQIDNNGDREVWNFMGTPVPTPPTILSPLSSASFNGRVGEFFSESITATGGVTPYTYDLTGGSLPGGVTLDTATGMFSGIPTAPGTFYPEFKVTTASGGESITTGFAIEISQLSIPDATKLSWIYHQHPGYFMAVTSSANGRNLTAIASEEMYISQDYGTTWEQPVDENDTVWSTITGQLISMTSNSDGSRLAVASNNNYMSQIWISSDYGHTWSNDNDAPTDKNYDHLTSSADGQYLAVTSNDGIWSSEDFGKTWILTSLPATWLDLASTADGLALAATNSAGKIWISQDRGATWADKTPPGFTSSSQALTFNSDGSQLFVGDQSGTLWISSDTGTTWTSYTNLFIDVQAPEIQDLVASADGSRLSAIVDGSNTNRHLFTSADFGETWFKMSAPFFSGVTRIASNASGDQIVVASEQVGIWVGPFAFGNASLASGRIKNVQLTNLGTPSRTIAGVIAGFETLTATASIDTTTVSLFTPSAFSSTVVKVVKYAAGASFANFATDAAFVSQAINDGDYFVIKVVAADSSTLYYRINTTIDFSNSGEFTVSYTGSDTNVNGKKIIDVVVTIDLDRCPSGCGFDEAFRIESQSGDFKWVDGCISEYGSPDNTCTLKIAFTPSQSGTQEATLSAIFLTSINSISYQNLVYVKIRATGTPIFNPTTAPYAWKPHHVPGLPTWQGITSSVDGTKLAAIIAGGNIYTSSDSGETWINSTFSGPASGSKFWTSITSSADGSKIAATTYQEGVYISSDSGATWALKSNIDYDLDNFVDVNLNGTSDVASSADGSILVVTTTADAAHGPIYLSINGGDSWTALSSAQDREWSSVALSSDASVMIASEGSYYRAPDTFYEYSGSLWTSIDSGTAWVEQLAPGQRRWTGVASNRTGSHFAAVALGSNIWTSSDTGITWIEQTGSGARDWSSIASSADGSKLVATVKSGNIYTSSDFGVTWVAATAANSRDWISIATSADGSSLAAVGRNIGVWTASPTPPVVVAPIASIVPSPLQQSKIDSISPSVLELMKSTKIVITGTFLEEIQSILIDGKPLSSGSWIQTSKTVTITYTGRAVGRHAIQLFNGSTPVLADQYITVENAVKAVEPAVTPTPVPTPKPTATPTSKPSPVVTEAAKPLKSTLVNRVYFGMGSAVVTKSNLITLKALASQIAGLGKKITINVTGYAQPTPKGASLDAALSKRRAAAVTKILKQLGVNTKVIYRGAGRAAKNVPSSRYVEIVAANS